MPLFNFKYTAHVNSWGSSSMEVKGTVSIRIHRKTLVNKSGASFKTYYPANFSIFCRLISKPFQISSLSRARVGNEMQHSAFMTSSDLRYFLDAGA